MAEIFPKWANRAPRYLALGAGAVGLLVPTAIGYYFSPRFTDVGYMPRQPVAFSHKLHAGELRIDCRYCHSTAEVAAVASVPPTQTCMNCHRLVGRTSESLAPVRDSFETGEPIRWIRVHKIPEYAYFNHAVHVGGGVGCSSCHGDVTSMEEIRQAEPLSMRWCLDCHRQPDRHLSPTDQIRRADLPTDCSACHR